MNYIVGAVEEALGLLMTVAHNPGLGVTELARRSDNTKARAFRLLHTLEHGGFVQRDRDATSYSLGPKSLVLGLAAQEQVGLTRLADKHLEALRDRFNEHAALLVRDELESVSIANKQSTHELRVQGVRGRRRPLYAGASGKVLLAFGTPELQAAVLEGGFEKFTSRTIMSKTRLKQELKRIAEQGYASSLSEMASDVLALAAPVFDASGTVQAAISLSMPASRAPEDLGRMIQAVRQAAADLSAELGWQPAD